MQKVGVGMNKDSSIFDRNPKLFKEEIYKKIEVNLLFISMKFYLFQGIMLEMQNTVSYKEFDKMKNFVDHEIKEQKQRQEYIHNAFLQSEKRVNPLIQDIINKLNNFQERIEKLEITSYRGTSKNGTTSVHLEQKINEELYEFRENLKKLNVRFEE